jgi:hypothetical protein
MPDTRSQPGSAPFTILSFSMPAKVRAPFHAIPTQIRRCTFRIVVIVNLHPGDFTSYPGSSTCSKTIRLIRIRIKLLAKWSGMFLPEPGIWSRFFSIPDPGSATMLICPCESWRFPLFDCLFKKHSAKNKTQLYKQECSVRRFNPNVAFLLYALQYIQTVLPHAHMYRILDIFIKMKRWYISLKLYTKFTDLVPSVKRFVPVPANMD